MTIADYKIGREMILVSEVYSYLRSPSYNSDDFAHSSFKAKGNNLQHIRI